MPIMALFRSPSVDQAQYDAIVQELDLESQPAAGGLIHACGFDDAGICVTEVWDGGGSGVRLALTPLEAARAPEESMPTSRAPVATPLRWAQTASGSSPTNCPFTKQRSGRFGSSLASSSRPETTTRPPCAAGGGPAGALLFEKITHATPIPSTSARPAPPSTITR